MSLYDEPLDLGSLPESPRPQMDRAEPLKMFSVHEEKDMQDGTPESPRPQMDRAEPLKMVSVHEEKDMQDRTPESPRPQMDRAELLEMFLAHKEVTQDRSTLNFVNELKVTYPTIAFDVQSEDSFVITHKPTGTYLRCFKLTGFQEYVCRLKTSELLPMEIFFFTILTQGYIQEVCKMLQSGCIECLCKDF